MRIMFMNSLSDTEMNKLFILDSEEKIIRFNKNLSILYMC